ncbi:MAG: ankyrin repeat domain-containing protein, partial [Legionella longbeachae]|nr:ankyrin repeat domain-containing protein [Legionella longbeachae]
LSDLKMAVINNDIQKVIKLLIISGMDPNELGHDNLTCLHYALLLKFPNLLLIKILLANKANPNIQDSNGNTCLHRACIIAMDIDHESKEEETFLHVPLYPVSPISLIYILLEYKADPNIKNNKNETPVHIACQNTNKEILTKLINHNANLNIKADSIGYPLQYVFEKNKTNFFNLLLKNNVKEVNTPLNDEYKNTPLHLAIKQHDFESVKLLLAKNANPNLKNLKKETSLGLLYQDLLSNEYPSLKLFRLILLCLLNGANCSDISKQNKSTKNIKWDKYAYLALKLIEFCKIAEQKNPRFVLSNFLEKNGLKAFLMPVTSTDLQLLDRPFFYQLTLGKNHLIGTANFSCNELANIEDKVNKPLMLLTLFNANPKLPKPLVKYWVKNLKDGKFIDYKQLLLSLENVSFYNLINALHACMNQEGYEAGMLVNANYWDKKNAYW